MLRLPRRPDRRRPHRRRRARHRPGRALRRPAGALGGAAAPAGAPAARRAAARHRGAGGRRGAAGLRRPVRRAGPALRLPADRRTRPGPPPLRRADTVGWPRAAGRRRHGAGRRACCSGEQDFAAFCRRREGATTIRTLLALDVARDGDLITVSRLRRRLLPLDGPQPRRRAAGGRGGAPAAGVAGRAARPRPSGPPTCPVAPAARTDPGAGRLPGRRPSSPPGRRSPAPAADEPRRRAEPNSRSRLVAEDARSAAIGGSTLSRPTTLSLQPVGERQQVRQPPVRGSRPRIDVARHRGRRTERQCVNQSSSASGWLVAPVEQGRLGERDRRNTALQRHAGRVGSARRWAGCSSAPPPRPPCGANPAPRGGGRARTAPVEAVPRVRRAPARAAGVVLVVQCSTGPGGARAPPRQQPPAWSPPEGLGWRPCGEAAVMCARRSRDPRGGASGARGQGERRPAMADSGTTQASRCSHGSRGADGVHDPRRQGPMPPEADRGVHEHVNSSGRSPSARVGWKASTRATSELGRLEREGMPGPGNHLDPPRGRRPWRSARPRRWSRATRFSRRGATARGVVIVARSGSVHTGGAGSRRRNERAASPRRISSSSASVPLTSARASTWRHRAGSRTAQSAQDHPAVEPACQVGQAGRVDERHRAHPSRQVPSVFQGGPAAIGGSDQVAPARRRQR